MILEKNGDTVKKFPKSNLNNSILYAQMRNDNVLNILRVYARTT